MATEGPPVHEVQVAEHPRWGRGDAALWDHLSCLGVDRYRAFDLTGALLLPTGAYRILGIL